MESNIEKLLKQMRATSSNSPLVSIMEQAQAAREGRKPVRAHKKYKQDKRTTRKKFYAWRRERADELREYNSGLRQMFFHVRREIRRRDRKQEELRAQGEAIDSSKNWKWNLTIGEWVLLWLGCPAIEVGHNVYKPAWQLRGRDKNNDVQLKRIDSSKPFELSNLEVRYKGVRINSQG